MLYSKHRNIRKPFLKTNKIKIDMENNTIVIPNTKLIIEPRTELLYEIRTPDNLEGKILLIEGKQINEHLITGNSIGEVKNNNVVSCIINSSEQKIEIEIPSLSENNWEIFDEKQVYLINDDKTKIASNRLTLLDEQLEL
jgi:hypothetical protein